MQALLKFKNEIIVLVVFIAAFSFAKSRWVQFKTRMAGFVVDSKDIETGKTLLAQWQTADGQYTAALQYLPFNQTAEFKSYVDAAAREAGLDINYVGPSREPHDFYETAIMTLKMAASYRQMAAFLEKIENGGKVVVTRLTVRNADREEGPASGKSSRAVEMVLRTYVKGKT